MKLSLRNLFFVIGLAAVCLMLVFSDIQYDMMIQKIGESLDWIPAILLLWLLLYAMNTLSWRLIIGGSGPCPIGFFRLLKITISGFALNSVTPAGLLGGEPYKAVEVTPDIGATRAGSSVLLFSLTHVFAHLCFWIAGAVLMICLLPAQLELNLLLLLVVLVCGLGVYFFFRGYRSGFLSRALSLLSRLWWLGRYVARVQQKWSVQIREVDAQIAALHAQSPRRLYATIALELAGRILQSVEVFLLLIIFNGSPANFHTLIVSIVILSMTSLFANLLFILPMQVGGREGGFVLSMISLGYHTAIGVSVALLCRVRELFWTIIGVLLIKFGNRPHSSGPPSVFRSGCGTQPAVHDGQMLKACLLLPLLMLVFPSMLRSQSRELLGGSSLTVSALGQLSTGDYAPLWLSSNTYGLAPVEANGAYERILLTRPMLADSAFSWRMGYGLDLALLQHGDADFVVQQAYVELGYKQWRLTVGAREYPMDLKNQTLTSGGLSMGINARPIPQVRIEQDYLPVPGMRGWWQWKFRLAYGWMTDGAWAEDFTMGTQRYAKDVLYHEKALYWRFGREDKFPLTFEIGLQMAAEFGGTTYNAFGRNVETGATLHHDAGLKAYWNAFLAGGSDETDGTESNTEGNHLGSYNMALRWQAPKFTARAYFERFFEDQSMLTLQYGIYDHLLGAEVAFRDFKPIRHIVVEHISTTDQSGAVYHDQTASMPEKMNGRDNYYNHHLYNGWMHWGRAIGNPLITSPVYSSTRRYTLDGDLRFRNNRIRAWHIGVDGQISAEWSYLARLSITQNRGIYDLPFDEFAYQTYAQLGSVYQPRWQPDLTFRLNLGYDTGGLLGRSFGAQLGISKQFRL